MHVCVLMYAHIPNKHSFLCIVYQLISSGDHNYETELCDQVVNKSTSYSEDLGFKSRPGNRLSSLNFCGFPQTLRANAGTVS
jgi:hypothetical protein